MKRVRDRLKELDNKLYESLVRSHEIAWNEWLPALSVKHDSYNSFPHIRNLEMYLDTIVTSYEDSRKKDFFVSAVEMYVMLASILFHDIGKIINSDNHASESSRIICGQSILFNEEKKEGNTVYNNKKVWASLGIPSHELAISIAKVCEFHDIDKNDEKEIKCLQNNLSSIFIDVLGEVRERSLAALLTLVDHLDSAHTRILPEYLKGPGEIEVVGAFRRVITGVYIDLKTQMVTTVLNEELSDGANTNIKYSFNKHLLTTEKKDITIDPTKELDNNALSELIDIIENKFDKIGNLTNISEQGIEKCKECLAIREYSFIDNFFSKGESTKLKFIDLMIIQGILYANIDKTGTSKVWPQNILQDLILGNVATNSKALQIIKSELESLEIPINAWLIEHKEHLYNYHGLETYEPIFSKSYLNNTASKMWELSTQIFGVSYFTYKSLASMMREPDINKVKTAVRRISILTTGSMKQRELNGNSDCSSSQNAIMAGDTNWKWVVENSSSDNSCRFLSLKQVKEIINEAGEANGM